MTKIESWNDRQVEEYLGEELTPLWHELVDIVESRYKLNRVWHTANKGEDVEMKYRFGSRTLLSLFPKFPQEDKIGVMIIFGKEQQKAFEQQQEGFAAHTREEYTDSPVFYDGKWVMYLAPNDGLLEDLPKLLAIKRKPDQV